MLSIMTGLDHHTTSKKVTIFTYTDDDHAMKKISLDRSCYWFMYRHLIAAADKGSVRYCPSAVSPGWTRFEFVQR